MAAASAATQARHNAVGHVLLPASANDAPVKNPTIDPRTINAFIRLNRLLAERLPLFFPAALSPWTAMFTGDSPAGITVPIRRAGIRRVFFARRSGIEWSNLCPTRNSTVLPAAAPHPDA